VGIVLKKVLRYLEVGQSWLGLLSALRYTFVFAKNSNFFLKKKLKKQWKKERNEQSRLHFHRKCCGIKQEMKWMGRTIPFFIKRFY